jgi:hypothetical protein
VTKEEAKLIPQLGNVSYIFDILDRISTKLNPDAILDEMKSIIFGNNRNNDGDNNKDIQDGNVNVRGDENGLETGQNQQQNDDNIELISLLSLPDGCDGFMSIQQYAQQAKMLSNERINEYQAQFRSCQAYLSQKREFDLQQRQQQQHQQQLLTQQQQQQQHAHDQMYMLQQQQQQQQQGFMVPGDAMIYQQYQQPQQQYYQQQQQQMYDPNLYYQQQQQQPPQQ